MRQHSHRQVLHSPPETTGIMCGLLWPRHSHISVFMRGNVIPAVARTITSVARLMNASACVWARMHPTADRRWTLRSAGAAAKTRTGPGGIQARSPPTQVRSTSQGGDQTGTPGARLRPRNSTAMRRRPAKPSTATRGGASRLDRSNGSRREVARNTLA